MSPNQPCPPPGKLRELIDGRVDEPDLSALAEHLEQCGHCQSQAKTLFVMPVTAYQTERLFVKDLAAAVDLDSSGLLEQRPLLSAAFQVVTIVFL